MINNDPNKSLPSFLILYQGFMHTQKLTPLIHIGASDRKDIPTVTLPGELQSAASLEIRHSGMKTTIVRHNTDSETAYNIFFNGIPMKAGANYTIQVGTVITLNTKKDKAILLFYSVEEDHFFIDRFTLAQSLHEISLDEARAESYPVLRQKDGRWMICEIKRARFIRINGKNVSEGQQLKNGDCILCNGQWLIYLSRIMIVQRQRENRNTASVGTYTLKRGRSAVSITAEGSAAVKAAEKKGRFHVTISAEPAEAAPARGSGFKSISIGAPEKTAVSPAPSVRSADMDTLSPARELPISKKPAVHGESLTEGRRLSPVKSHIIIPDSSAHPGISRSGAVRPMSPVRPAAGASAASHAPVRPRKVFRYAKSLNIAINDRTVQQGGKKITLLKDINLSIQQGEMVLILGGSGAGKTTLLQSIMGYEQANGIISYDHFNIYRDYEKIKNQIGYVPQDDLVRPGDTVIATLKDAAQMKLKNTKRAEKKLRVDHTLETLGLSREKSTMVSKLSGGQRKRLSIALEYIANPPLFFLDEPDSGLDGTMGRELMRNLRAIADEGKIILVISHQPDRSVELWDKVIVLAKSEADNIGHLAFFGSPDEAKRFFSASSLEEVVRCVNRKDEGGKGLSDYYINSFSKRIAAGGAHL